MKKHIVGFASVLLAVEGHVSAEIAIALRWFTDSSFI
jgi:hypothetical protein